ncbi:MAG: 16S rRNA (guanine(966)-N(2))-methyltransferase RsmD [Halieaceae bacterium]|jgi:16S rRNA (guanine966-N2)-methyltransferase|nr:16S rRNA (guanine(966)-N(2))-methyltransferase RsmD [Halieaceae bacterium]
MAQAKNKPRGSVVRNQLRIIGGRWRSRKLTFIPDEGLRPTPDRVRETLYNWLAPVIAGATCLDLYAGSGSLGLEALSRGATHCHFVDTSGDALKQINSHLITLGATTHGHCHQGTAEDFLLKVSTPLDIVFIDPPFGQGLVVPICNLLAARQLLSEDALIYIETPRQEELSALPRDWQIHREKTAGQVAFRLFRCNRV